ncbi:hypothetical protein C8J57DRAFT_1245220 [Mycena rebaudengoi]|nr:hypothetical protein C8J57DRAFT_1245220 [Mycena rebaudengoi]
MARILLRLSSAALILSNTALGLHLNVSRRAVTPAVASATSYGSLLDKGLNRDSCTSTLWSNNVLWTCRDTQEITSSGQVGLGVFANTAAFSGMPSAKSNAQRLVLAPQPLGKLFYPLESDECPQYGLCSDNSRWVGWPDTGPVVTFRGSSGQVNAYSFIQKKHLSGLSQLNRASTSLYHVISQTAGPLPATSVVGSSFWTSSQIGYGSAASVVTDNFVYLYGATSSGKLALARADHTGFLGSLEDHSIYEYYVNGAWTRTIPASDNAEIIIPNTSSAQGTIYFSPKWQSFVWMGGDGFPNARFLISTAPKPWGPWTAAKLFYTGAVGTGALPAYSAVAHPALTDGTAITSSSLLQNAQGQDVYDQPLVRVDWQ